MVRALNAGASRRLMPAIVAAVATLFCAGHAAAQVDYNRDGFITFEDFDDFVVDFIDGKTRSDLNSDTAIDFSDFDTFIQAKGNVNFWFYWMVTSREAGRNDMDTETDLGDTPVRRDCFILYAQQFSKALWLFDTKGTTTTADDVMVDEGVHVMLRDPGLAPSGTYTNWQSNYNNWMTAHAANVRSVLGNVVENPNFAGAVALDFERVYPSWDGLQRIADGSPLLTAQVTKWYDMLSKIHANAWDPAFLTLVGYVPPLGKLKWSDLNAPQQYDLCKRSYNLFAIDYFVQTVNNARLQRPKAKFGFYNMPIAWYTNLFNGQQADNDTLASIWASVDALYPSMYAKYYSTTDLVNDPPLCPNANNTPAENDLWYQSVVNECSRIRTLWGRAGQKIMPFVWWHYHDSAVSCIDPSPCARPALRFLRGANLSQGIRQPWLYGADALMLWGFLGYTPCQSSYADDPAVLGPEIRTNWNPIMQGILPVPTITAPRGVDLGPWNDSPPWRGNLGFDGIVSPSEQRPEVVNREPAQDR